MLRPWLETVLRALLSGLLLIACILPRANAQPVRQELRSPATDDDKPVWPYVLINYTQSAHDYRIMNSSVVALGQIESLSDTGNPQKFDTYGA